LDLHALEQIDPEITDRIADIIADPGNESIIDKTGENVREVCEAFPIYENY
jgi:hypothetical protein